MPMETSVHVEMASSLSVALGGSVVEINTGDYGRPPWTCMGCERVIVALHHAVPLRSQAKALSLPVARWGICHWFHQTCPLLPPLPRRWSINDIGWNGRC